jgi:multisubunit Na+/H+ antiporter MnhE subunit
MANGMTESRGVSSTSATSSIVAAAAVWILWLLLAGEVSAANLVAGAAVAAAVGAWIRLAAN